MHVCLNTEADPVAVGAGQPCCDFTQNNAFFSPFNFKAWGIGGVNYGGGGCIGICRQELRRWLAFD